MPSIKISTELPLAAMAVGPVVLQVLQDIGEGRKPFEGYALRLHLGGAASGSAPSIEVPINVTLLKTSSFPPYTIGLTLEAASNRQLFPAFEGTLLTSAIASAVARIELSGDYQPPLGPLGAALDATLFQGVAQTNLAEFLRVLVEEVNERVKRIEYETAEIMLRSH